MDIETKRFYISQDTDSGDTRGITIFRNDGFALHYSELEQLQILVASVVERLVLPEEADLETKEAK